MILFEKKLTWVNSKTYTTRWELVPWTTYYSHELFLWLPDHHYFCGALNLYWISAQFQISLTALFTMFWLRVISYWPNYVKIKYSSVLANNKWSTVTSQWNKMNINTCRIWHTETTADPQKMEMKQEKIDTTSISVPNIIILRYLISTTDMLQ